MRLPSCGAARRPTWAADIEMGLARRKVHWPRPRRAPEDFPRPPVIRPFSFAHSTFNLRVRRFDGRPPWRHLAEPSRPRRRRLAHGQDGRASGPDLKCCGARLETWGRSVWRRSSCAGGPAGVKWKTRGAVARAKFNLGPFCRFRFGLAPAPESRPRAADQTHCNLQHASKFIVSACCVY
jgi:hypothetical protein